MRRDTLRELSRQLLWPTVAATLVLAVLVALGIWQLDRREWKLALVARVEARAKAPPTDLALAIDEWAGSRDVEYVHSRARGVFLHDKERYLYVPDPSLGPGVDVLTPMRLEDGHILWVDRGFVPDRLKAPETRAAGQVKETVEVTGLLRASAVKPRFAAGNDPAHNFWLWRDLPALTRSAFPNEPVEVLPFAMDADAGLAPGGWPQGGRTRLTFLNDHLQYALTWFGLAAALIAIWLAYAVRRLGALRRASDDEPPSHQLTTP
jgi:surfeit locus 1 family protein